MSRYEPKDRYYQKAKAEGLPSRASFKIREINQKFQLIKGGDRVIDLGCSPGGWLAILGELVGPTGKVIGVDFARPTIPIAPPIYFIEGDVTEPATIAAIRAEAPQVDVVVSDLAPKTTGIKFADSLKSIALGEIALSLCDALLKPNGNFVAKLFPGAELPSFQTQVKSRFARVSQFIPDSTRKTSIEIYLVGIGYKM